MNFAGMSVDESIAYLIVEHMKGKITLSFAGQIGKIVFIINVKENVCL